MTDNLAPLALRTVRTQAADSIRSSILDGRLSVGSRIVERRLAEQLGTSLTAIREALVQLESEGLIVKKPNATTHVIALESSDIEQIFDVRMVLECHAFELAANRIRPEQVEHLKALHAAGGKSARHRHSREYVQADLLWHETVWRISENTYLYSAIRRLVLPLFMYSALHIAENLDFNLVEDSQTHNLLIEALQTGEASVVRRAFLPALARWRDDALAGALSLPIKGPND